MAHRSERAIPVLPADGLKKAKRFYVDRLGFQVAFEASEDGMTGIMGVSIEAADPHAYYNEAH